MDRPFHVSRNSAQFVRRRLPNCEIVAYSIPSRTRTEKDERTKERVSYSRGMSKEDRVFVDGSFPAYHAIHEISSQHVNISGHCQKGSNSLKLAATPENWMTRHYNHYLRLDGQERLSNPPSRRRILPRSRYHVRYPPFGQVLYGSPVCNFASNGWFSGRVFSTSAAVRPLSPFNLTLLII
jgi:hypothetical protein